MNVEKGNFAVVLYDETCYIGKVIDVDDEDDTVHISFMEQCMKMEDVYSALTQKINYVCLSQVLLKV